MPFDNGVKNMSKETDVRLDLYKQKYDEALFNFRLPEEQEKFTSLPQHCIPEVKVDKTMHPVVILHDEAPVGFFVLRSGDVVKKYTENPKALLLTRLSIDESSQGKGYGKKGMNLLGDFVKRQFSECDEIVLAVNHKNIPAQKLYEKVGFVDTGKRIMGKIGEQFVFKLQI